MNQIRFAILVTLALGLAILAQPKRDITKSAFPPEPAPVWVRYIDQGKNDPRLKGYRTPEGIKLEIVAEAPVVVNPIGLSFDEVGTPHVLQWRPGNPDKVGEETLEFTYQDKSTRKVRVLKKDTKDAISILLDEDADGKFDKAKVALEQEFPSGVVFRDGWLYVSGRGTVRRYKKSKPDGDYDTSETIAKGFGGFGHQQVSGLTFGPDGHLYITVGAADHHVEGSDGSRATVLRSGAIFRSRPDGSKLQTFAIGFFNPYGPVAFDALGNMFHADNDSAKTGKFAGCRLMHVSQGNDFGYRGQPGCPTKVDESRAAAFGEKPGKVPGITKVGPGAPTGLFSYDDTRLPLDYQGLVFYPDMWKQSVRAYALSPKGASFEILEEFVLLDSKDPFFRPCQVTVGPDGALYIVDYRTDITKTHTRWGDGKNGRIYRLSWAGIEDIPAIALRKPDSWKALAEQEDKELIKVLASDEASLRGAAVTILRARGDKNKKALVGVLAGDAFETTKMAAFEVLLSMWDEKVQRVTEELLALGDSSLRRQAALALASHASKGDKKAHAALLRALGDDHLAVRRAVLMAMAQVGSPGAGDILASALGFDDTKDRMLQDGFERALETLGKNGMDRLLALAESGVEDNLLRVVRSLRGLRTPEGAKAISRMLKYPHLTIDQRADLIRAHHNFLYEPATPFVGLVEYLSKHPDEAAPVIRAGVEVFAHAQVIPPKAKAWLVSQLDSDLSSVHLAALEVVTKRKIVEAHSKLVEMSKDTTRTAAVLKKIEAAIQATKPKQKK